MIIAYLRIIVMFFGVSMWVSRSEFPHRDDLTDKINIVLYFGQIFMLFQCVTETFSEAF